MKKIITIIAVLFAAISFSYGQFIPLRNNDVRQIANGDTSRFYITPSTLSWLSTNPVILNNNFWTTGALTANGATTLTNYLEVRGETFLGDAATDTVTVTGTTYLTTVPLNTTNLSILGKDTTTNQVKRINTVNLATLGVLTETASQNVSNKTLDETNILPIWRQLSGTYATDSTFTFSGSYLDVQKYNRSIFTCLDSSKDMTVTGLGASNYLKFAANTKYKLGDLIWFVGGTLPTASPVLVKQRAYHIVTISAAGDSVQIAETPGGTAINITTNGSGIKARVSIVGYVYALSISGTTVTATVHRGYALAAADSNFRVTQQRKMMDYKESIYTGSVECVADASNPQGRRMLNWPNTSYLIAVQSALGTAAVGAGAACAYNVYSGATALFASAPDLGTRSVWNPAANSWLQEFPTTKYIAAGSNITMRNTSVGGATTKPAFLELDLYLVPINLFCIP